MISKDEIISVANETGLTPNVVEKDYVLGWLLAAINVNQALSEAWVFKGGTCLKKCYFETYRFSEDLDFTLKDVAQLDAAFLTEQFTEIAAWLYEEAGIEIPVDRLVFDVYDNPRGGKSCEGKVYYQSYFASGKRSLPKIKFDLTADEILVMPPSRQPVFHPYTDSPGNGIFANCYSYPEVFGEKVRALGERGRPRDLYDVVNLYRNKQLPPSALIRDVLAQKCAYKKINPPVLADIEAYKDSLRSNWEPMLAHQLPALPPLEVYWDALPGFFAWLEGQEAEAPSTLETVSSEGQAYRPAYGRLGLHTRSGSSLEIIRFAAGNRLCVNLDYTDSKGQRSTRLIEPYSLRRAANGNILLHAVRAEDGQSRSYNIDQINDASISNQVFVPRYSVELSPTDHEVPVTTLAGNSHRIGIPPRTSNLTNIRRTSTRRSSSASGGPVYVYRCPFCDKKFKHKSQDPTLRQHKTKDGWPCPGRNGYFEKIEY